MRYEEIVTKPEEAWGEVFDYLEMPFDRSAWSYSAPSGSAAERAIPPV